MAHMNIFQNDAFRAMELSEAVNIIPNQWGLVGELGVFTPKPVRGTSFSLEMKNGHLQLVQSSERGTPLPGQARGKRSIRDFRTLRFGLKSRILPDDVDGIRAFGSETELKQVSSEVMDRQEELRGSIDITREYLRCGALQGVVKDADGSTIMDLFSEFGVTQKVVDFVLGTGTTDLGAKCRAVTRHIQTNLKGDVSAGVMCLMSPEFSDKLQGHSDFKERYKYFQKTNGFDPLTDPTSEGFLFNGIWWKEYLAEADVPQEDGTTVQQKFIPEGDARFFPRGTRTTFREFNGSADYMGMVNQPGRPFYSAVFPDRQEDRFADVEVMMQTLTVCTRPATLVRGHSSN